MSFMCCGILASANLPPREGALGLQPCPWTHSPWWLGGQWGQSGLGSNLSMALLSCIVLDSSLLSEPSCAHKNDTN